MPGWVMKMIYEAGELTDDQKRIYDWARATFPIGALENLPTDFLVRCRPSDDPAHPECIVFTYADGMTPYQIQVTPGYNMTPNTMPTYKQIYPRKVSLVGKLGTVSKGAVVKQTCGYKFCVNQKHLEYGGIQPNQHSESGGVE